MRGGGVTLHGFTLYGVTLLALVALCFLILSSISIVESQQNGSFDRDGPWTVAFSATLPNPLSVTPPTHTTLDISHTAGTNTAATFYADPFFIVDHGTIYLFYELKWAQSRLGWFWNGKGILCVSVRTPTDEGFQFGGVVLKESFHLSYPHVFTYQGEHYMIPETNAVREIRLYQAHAFPHDWRLHRVLVSGHAFVDTSIVWWHNRCYLITMDRTVPHEVRIYHSDDILNTTFQEHPASPYPSHTSRARNAGRIVVHEGRIYRPAQDDSRIYGERVMQVEITRLSATEYVEAAEAPVWLQGSGTPGSWCEHKMHHIDVQEVTPGRYMAAMDGQ
jgi:hypothetical protein